MSKLDSPSAVYARALARYRPCEPSGISGQLPETAILGRQSYQPKCPECGNYLETSIEAATGLCDVCARRWRPSPTPPPVPSRGVVIDLDDDETKLCIVAAIVCEMACDRVRASALANRMIDVLRSLAVKP